jgi:hypothetical protein
MDKSWFFDRVRACDRLGVNWDAMMRVGMQAEQDGQWGRYTCSPLLLKPMRDKSESSAWLMGSSGSTKTVLAN